jgi:hypothetical protein
MRSRLAAFLFGSPLPTYEMAHKRLNKIRALAAFSPDALSSIAYANQEIFLGLVVAGSSGLLWTFPIGLVITGLLAILTLLLPDTVCLPHRGSTSPCKGTCVPGGGSSIDDRLWS